MLTSTTANDQDLHPQQVTDLVQDHGMESAIVLVIPEAQVLLESVWAHTGAQRPGMPGHVTLLYPFVPDPDPGVVEELRFFFAGVDGFELTFSSVGAFPEVVFLAPDEAHECVALTEALARRWPDFPPYSGKFDQVVPHLTVVNTPDAELREQVRLAAEERLPVRALVREASLWLRGDDQSWRCVGAFPLAPVEP